MVRFPLRYKEFCAERGYALNRFINEAVTMYLRRYSLDKLSHGEVSCITKTRYASKQSYPSKLVLTSVRLMEMHIEFIKLNQLILSRVIVYACEYLYDDMCGGIIAGSALADLEQQLTVNTKKKREG